MFRFLLNLLFPPKPLVAELEEMGLEEFSARVEHSQTRIGNGIISLLDYRHSLTRRAVWELKYRGNARVAALLGALLHTELLSFLEEYAEIEGISAPLLVPIPLSPARRRARGFNQCELLLEALQKLDTAENFAVEKNALVKTKDTPSQTKSGDRAARLTNLKDCFSVKNPSLVKDRDIILIDDVATTGATIEEARRTLLAAGARMVFGFTIAH